jgi:hypothetical protein
MLEAQKLDPADMLLAQAGAPAPAVGAQVPGGPAVATGADGQAGVLPYRSETNRDASTDSHNSTTQLVESPAINQAAGELATATQDKVKALQDQSGAKVKIEGIEADGADQVAKEKQRDLDEQKALRDAHDANVSRIMSEREAARKDRDATKPITYDESMGTLRKMLSALSIGLGEYASKTAGGPNTALEIYKDGSSAFYQKQEKLIAAKANAVLEKTGDLAAAREVYAKDKADLLDRQIIRNEHAQALINAQIKRVPQQEAIGKATVAGLQIDASKDKLAQANLLAEKKEKGSTTHGAERSVTDVSGTKPGSGSNAKPTQFEQTLALHGDTMQKSIDLLRYLKPISSDALSTAQDNESYLDAAAESNKTIGGAAKVSVLRKLGAIPRNKGEGLSENDQLYLNAVDAANEGFQRVLSGANIQEKERSRLSNQLAVQPNDPPKVVQWKLAKMEREKDNFLLLAGKAGEQITQRNAAEAAAKLPTYVKKQENDSPVRPRMDATTRDRLKEAYKQKPGSPDYAGARRFIKSVTSQFGGGN